jgi:hypothetical protein
MSQLWFVYSRDKTFGPWSSSEVRDQLRSGNIDPFDMVSSDGSPVKRPLVEVDEIFQSSRIQMGALIENGVIEESAAVVGGNQPKPTAVSLETRQNSQDLSNQKPVSLPPVNKSLDVARPKQFQSLAIESRIAKKRFAKPGKRHYFVTDSARRVLGPMSSSDVISLWQKGIVDRSATVEKKGQPRKISLEKFVGFYQLGGSHSDPGVRIGGDGLQRYYNHRFKHAIINQQRFLPVIALIFVLLLVIGLLAFKLLDAPKQATNRSTIGTNTIQTESKNEVAKVESPESLPSAAGPIVNTHDQRKGTSNSQFVTRESSPKIQSETARKAAQNAQRSKNIGRERNSNQYVSRPTYRPGPKPVSILSKKQTSSNQSTSQKPAEEIKRVKSIDSPKPVIPKRVSSPGPRSTPPKQWSDGQSLSVSARFASSAVQTCSAKCKLQVHTPSGPLTAVFFKAAFGEKLRSAKGSARLSGIVRKQANGSWQIIVSGVE